METTTTNYPSLCLRWKAGLKHREPCRLTPGRHCLVTQVIKNFKSGHSTRNQPSRIWWLPFTLNNPNQYGRIEQLLSLTNHDKFFPSNQWEADKRIQDNSADIYKFCRRTLRTAPATSYSWVVSYYKLLCTNMTARYCSGHSIMHPAEITAILLCTCTK